ncbi:alpha-E domain-containing protein [uncultured Catenibacterium sp.]|uniref:alpha-E domain-containing protein n=1 Tax=uncultured Catenibacterium sp. TaxID=286142 RepID=UPI0025EF07B8|nr:alpha-E domain-containing protein [uncultured Catenibacterium sp.]
MGAITIEKANHSFWLGRYLERVYTTTLHYMNIFDTMLDQDDQLYIQYCQQLDIPNIYFNEAHFMMSYLYDMDNPDSIACNLKRAYDNAIILREDISSKLLSYIQMGVNTFETISESEAPVLLLQNVLDDILAFKGGMEEYIDDNAALNIIKLGEYIERLDLYVRLDYPIDQITKNEYKLLDVSNELYTKTLLLQELDLETIYKSSLIDYIHKVTNAFNY